MVPGEGSKPPAVILKELRAALDAAHAVPLSCLDSSDLGEWICTVESTIGSKTDALRAKSVSAGTDAQIGPLHGSRTIDQYVAARVPVNPQTVRSYNLLGQWLHDFPLLEEAFAAGHVSYDHLDELRRIDRNRHRRLHRYMIDAQEFFIEAATEVDDWDEFGRAVGYWVNIVDPDGNIPKEQLACRKWAMRKNADGSWTGSFRFDPVTGQAVNTAIEAEEQRLLDEDAEHGYERTAQQRKADAVAAVVTRGAARNPDSRVATPLVHIVIGEKTAEQMVEAATSGSEEAIEIDPNNPDYRCEFADGTPVHPNLAMAVLAVANFKQLVLEPPSRILDLGRSTRSFPRDIKMAILVAARGRCRSPGCDAPFSWLQADHIHAWANHFPTSTENSQAKCGPDNRFKGAS